MFLVNFCVIVVLFCEGKERGCGEGMNGRGGGGIICYDIGEGLFIGIGIFFVLRCC